MALHLVLCGSIGVNINRLAMPRPTNLSLRPQASQSQQQPHLAQANTAVFPTATMPPKAASTTSPRDQRPSTSRPKSSPVKNAYLLAYNAVSAALWAGVLYKTVTIGAHEIQTARKAGSFFGRNDLQSAAAGLASGKVFGELEEYTRMVQSLAGLEVLHSLLGTLPFSPCCFPRIQCNAS